MGARAWAERAMQSARPGFKSLLCLSLNVWFWASPSASPSLRFHRREMGKITVNHVTMYEKYSACDERFIIIAVVVSPASLKWSGLVPCCEFLSPSPRTPETCVKLPPGFLLRGQEGQGGEETRYRPRPKGQRPLERRGQWEIRT